MDPADVPKSRRVVLLRDFVDVECSLPDAQRRLSGDGAWLLPLARSAANEGEQLLAGLLPPPAGRRTGVPVEIHLLRSTQLEDCCIVPVRWQAATLSGLFPVLDGNLELTPLGPQRCRVGLSASYRPPLGAVGEWLDHVWLHRVAESTVRSFLTQLGAHLVEPEP